MIATVYMSHIWEIPRRDYKILVQIYSCFFNNWNFFFIVFLLMTEMIISHPLDMKPLCPCFMDHPKGAFLIRARARSGPGDRSDKFHHYRLSGSSLRSPHIRDSPRPTALQTRPAVRVSDSQRAKSTISNQVNSHARRGPWPPFSFIIPIKKYKWTKM